jgi:hypothetical protein
MHTPTIEGLQQDQVRCNNITAASGSVVDASVIPTRNGDRSGVPETTSQTLPPHVRLIEMGTAFWGHCCINLGSVARDGQLRSRPVVTVQAPPLPG